ncbi:MAG: DUF1801 domain-containing protein [Chitinophagaceae bacterium]
MQSTAPSVNEYIKELPEDRKTAFEKLRNTIKKHLPKKLVEEMSYGMIGYVVPHTVYPKGYHCSPELPLPFISIASQKNFIALYHMGIYSKPSLLEWFIKEYPKHCKHKLDMGKSCIRFKKVDDIPFELIAQLMQKMTVDEWIELYESLYIKKK